MLKNKGKHFKKEKINFMEILIILVFILLPILVKSKLITFADLVEYVMEIIRIYKGLA